MIVGIGIDITEVGKIAESGQRETYLRKVFTPAEIADCQQAKNAAQRFAGKFAIKEAFMKAIGAGIRQGVWFRDIEVLNEDTGKPHVVASNKAAEHLRTLHVTAIWVSLSHTAEVAVGVVILEQE
jgi:holo-[acyl-carrier protein] synthase